MAAVTLLLLGGGALLYLGAEALLRGSGALALRLGLPPIAVGLTVVAYGTSTPELVVSVDAALTGHAGVALGNVIGASVLNLTLILGVAALIHPVRATPQALRLDVPMMVAAALLGTLVFRDGVIARWEGACLLAGLVLHLGVKTAWVLRYRAEVAGSDALVHPPGTTSGTWRQVGLIVAGLALLAGGAHALLLGAVSAARALGVSEAVIGLTVVSVGSALPELITTMVGAWRGQGDLVLGNAVGSCICNVFGVLGLTAFITPLRDPALLPAHFLAFLAAAALVAPLLWTGHTLARREGVALLGAYALYLFTMRPG